MSPWPGSRDILELACSAGVFFGRANVVLAKAHVKTFPPPPPPLFPSFALASTLRFTIFTLPNLPPS